MKLSRIISGIAAGIFAAFCMTFTAFAEPKDFEPSITRAVQTNGAWGQSITFSSADIKATGIGPDSTVEVQYELEGDQALPGQYQVELILQNYEADPQIWAQVVPFEYDDTHAIFDYDAMVVAYGSDDFSTVNNICIGDRGVKMKVTYVKITNYDPSPAATTEAQTEAETEAVTEAVTEAANEPAETEATTSAPDSSSAPESGNSIMIIIFVIGAVVLVAAIVVIIIVTKKNKKRFY
ncbi:MAG: hypothetical protein ACI4SF_08705 [Oscillospiraceae bacterium]